jgi:phage terminase small subunit
MAKPAPAARPAAPAELSTAMKHYWKQIVERHELQQHEFRILHLACQASDTCDQARATRAEHGMTYIDGFGAPRLRPEVAIERDGRLAFARLLRDLDLRPPAWGDLLPIPT